MDYIVHGPLTPTGNAEAQLRFSSCLLRGQKISQFPEGKIDAVVV
jgi:hypothetical protein